MRFSHFSGEMQKDNRTFGFNEYNSRCICLIRNRKKNTNSGLGKLKITGEITLFQ
jgi:hypothetical protein